jgi:hypothetical protein
MSPLLAGSPVAALSLSQVNAASADPSTPVRLLNAALIAVIVSLLLSLIPDFQSQPSLKASTNSATKSGNALSLEPGSDHHQNG